MDSNQQPAHQNIQVLREFKVNDADCITYIDTISERIHLLGKKNPSQAELDRINDLREKQFQILGKYITKCN